ncbi:hypothetical protein DFH07DRAFT_802499 [Mycena maculata]|uniref:Uncharacterized protein n=1 Tax=Mycena maculata TaxID=230809 RepID=A0AAD7NRW8_9AGAR|nr:hypothetical protein DFH07DRAFT_802499 [Mycena maculata]
MADLVELNTLSTPHEPKESSCIAFNNLKKAIRTENPRLNNGHGIGILASIDYWKHKSDGHDAEIQKWEEAHKKIVDKAKWNKAQWDAVPSHQKSEMWAAVQGIPREDLDFNIKFGDPDSDLVLVRSAETVYGIEIVGKIRMRAVRLDSTSKFSQNQKGDDGKYKVLRTADGKIDDGQMGFIFVRIHHPHDKHEEATFHSIYHHTKDGVYRAIQPNNQELIFFNQ